MGFFREFYDHKKFVRSLNTTFLLLIPKKRDAGVAKITQFPIYQIYERSMNK